VYAMLLDLHGKMEEEVLWVPRRVAVCVVELLYWLLSVCVCGIRAARFVCVWGRGFVLFACG
jgi:hypothetical protein